MSRAVYPASALVEREATLSGARPFRSAAPNKSFEALAFVTDFNGLGMFFHVLRAIWRGESVPLTMPRMSLKSDRTWLEARVPSWGQISLGGESRWERVSSGARSSEHDDREQRHGGDCNQ
jgi:hypothetical protein